MNVKTIFRIKQHVASRVRIAIAPNLEETASLGDRRSAHRRLCGIDIVVRKGLPRNPRISEIIARTIAGRPPQLYRSGA